MTNKKIRNKKKPVQNKSEKQSKLVLRIFYVIIISYLVFTIFFEPKTVGNDIRYYIFVFWIPTILGMIISYYKFSFIRELWNDLFFETNDKIYKKIFASLFLVLSWFIMSYLTFGFLANITWNCVNKFVADNNPVEIYFLPIQKFSRTTGKGGSNRIIFQFKNDIESIKISYDDIKPYLDKNPNSYLFELQVRKGIWNYYILEDWKINP